MIDDDAERFNNDMDDASERVLELVIHEANLIFSQMEFIAHAPEPVQAIAFKELCRLIAQGTADRIELGKFKPVT